MNKQNQNQTTQKQSQLPGASQGFVPNQGAKAERPNTQREEQDLDGSDVNKQDRNLEQGDRDKQRQSR